MKKVRKKISRPSSKFLLIILCLFILGLLLTFIHVLNSDPFRVLSENHDNSISRLNNRRLTAGKKITAEFVSKENYLGIVAVRFNTLDRVNQDVIIFRIKEKGSKNWYYQNYYPAVSFSELPNYPFGFPLIADSKGKTYMFQLESTLGDRKNFVEVDNIKPIVTAKYQYPKAFLLGNKLFLQEFIYKKILYSVYNRNLIFSLIVYMLPLFLYLFLWPIVKKYRITIVVFLIALDIFYLKNIYDFVSLVLTILWLIFVFRHKWSSEISFYVGLIFLICSPIFSLFKFYVLSEKLIIWAYFFLIAGTIQSVIELREKKK